MGTSNFFKRNADAYYSVFMSYEAPKIDENGDETEEMEIIHPDEWDCQLEVEYWQEKFAEKCKEKGYHFNAGPTSRYRKDATEFGQITVDVDMADGNLRMCYTLMYNYGYYEGACLDFDKDFVFDHEGYTYDAIPEQKDFKYELSEATDNPGLAAMLAPKFEAKARKISDEVEILINATFAELSGVTLEAVATFSNGETIYAKV